MSSRVPTRSGGQPPARIHPFTRILLWLCFVVAVQISTFGELFLLAVLAALLAVLADASHWFRLLRRTRWLTFSLILIYAFATPGEQIWQLSGAWGPSKEGLIEGGLQMLRLHCALAALSVLLSGMDRQQLLAGLYVCSYPLKFMGALRQRFVVRLALSLSYAENAMSEMRVHSLRDLSALFAAEAPPGEHIELQLDRMGARDVLLVALVILALTGMLL